MQVDNLSNLPDKPGVYFFRKGSEILYIGKATSIRDRVRSYFSRDLGDSRGPMIVKMLELSTNIKYRTTDSVLEALILEADLIKRHQPLYNRAERDDKSFNYVVITKEDYPQVLVVRGKELPDWTERIKECFGPFPHGLELRETLKIIRKIFPFRDEKCRPGKACFNRQIGLCSGVCTGEISKREYAKVIRSISLMFKGRKQEIFRGLRKHMREESVRQNFEKAAELRNKIFALEHINDVAMLRRNIFGNSVSKGKPSFRIEAYDISHISGESTVGAMVIMENSVLQKHEYKRFKVRTRKNDDPGALAEVLSRRFRHKEWGMPDLLVLDGGEIQRRIGLKFLANVVSVVKDEHHKPLKILGESAIVRDYHHDILAINAEAHRFAIAYHKRIRDKIRK